MSQRSGHEENQGDVNAFTLRAIQQQFERFNLTFTEMRETMERRGQQIAELRRGGREEPQAQHAAFR